ncbi:leucine-rich repeat protein [Treponema bryantii]|uniref:leucine-rich repeat protein n=1 Tax=Treponema bryantii TaxID=163 RepID=UPI0003B4ABB9|nr:leucine-rich repeat protein [Treponema bryantii]
MKKNLSIIISLMMVLSCFAKEIPLQITETDFGLEISNFDSKGKRICKGDLNFDYTNEVYIIFKNKSDKFQLESLAHEIVYNNALIKFLVLEGETFSNATLNKKTQKYGPLANYDSILVVSKDGKFLNYKAISDGKNLNLILSDFQKDETLELNKRVIQLTTEKERIEAEEKAEQERLAAERKAEEERLAAERKAEEERRAYQKKIDDLKLSADKINEYLGYSDVYKTDLYAYYMDKSGDLAIICYLGESVDTLVVPEKIEGIPVGTIYSLQSLNNAKFKNVTIPKSVTTISDNACVGLGIEKLNFGKDSKLSRIGVNAFRYNEIHELNLPRKELTICFDAFSDNKIKKISVYKDWGFQYHTPYNKFSLEYCITQEDNAFLKSDLLEEVIFEEGCTYIAPKCFAECHNLKKLSIPSTMRKFGAYAFNDCTSLSDISFAGIPIADVDTLEDLYKKAKLQIDPDEDLLGLGAALQSYTRLVTDPWSAVKAFGNCPVGLKVKRTLLKMGLPENAF